MDPLIRAARLAPVRTRLSETRIARAAVSQPAGVAPPQHDVQRPPADVLREQIYRQLWAELNARTQETLHGERERAHADGYADGIEAGRCAAARELDRAREQLKTEAATALDAMAKAQRDVLSTLQSHIGEVAFAAICSLAGEKAASQGFVLGVVERTCAQLRAELAATVRMHPRDIRTLGQLLDGDELRIGALGLTVVPDESLALGGCLIDTAAGQYEGGLEGQLRRLHSLLANDVARRAVDEAPQS